MITRADSNGLFHERWYTDADAYWSRIDATDDGMLGGLAMVHRPDIQQSRAFIRALMASGKLALERRRACDCGAGIGRVSKHLLVGDSFGAPLFDSVDLVEFTAKFLDKASADPVLKAKAERFVCTGLEKFEPEMGRYDLIWVQWVIGHLSDDDMVAFIRRCLTALDAPDKLLIFKENTCLFKDYIVDAEDSSVTRSDAVFRRLFAKAGATLVAVEQQRGFPDDLYPVTMYALARAPLFDENDKENDDVRQQQ